MGRGDARRASSGVVARVFSGSAGDGMGARERSSAERRAWPGSVDRDPGWRSGVRRTAIGCRDNEMPGYARLRS
jgi:hypothetical protein